LKERYPNLFYNVDVLELGSYNENGTVRDFFNAKRYVGVDWRPGPCVDVVCLAHEYDDRRLFDVLITTEMLEHDPYWKQSLLNGIRLLRNGGSVIITCASPDRPEHYVHTSPKKDYYKGLNPDEILSVTDKKFRYSEIETDDKEKDTRILLLDKHDL